jgi:hypothetical protein
VALLSEGQKTGFEQRIESIKAESGSAWLNVIAGELKADPLEALPVQVLFSLFSFQWLIDA